MEKLLLAALVIMTGPILGWFFRPFRRLAPLVIIQIAWGFMLGPSVLGRLYPQVFHALLPDETIVGIDWIGKVAAIFFVFLTGLHLNVYETIGRGDKHGRKADPRQAKKFWSVSFLSILIPGGLNMLAGWYLWSAYPALHGTAATFTVFVFSMGLVAGVTALPVLSAILIESGRINSRIGKFVLSCSTIHDGLLWILLTGLLALVGANGSHAKVWAIIIMATAYVLGMVFVVRKFFSWVVKTTYWEKALPDYMKMSVELILLLASAYITERIGIHYLVGAVVYGAILPEVIRRPLKKRVESFVHAGLLPFFFVSAGLKCNIAFDSVDALVMFSTTTLVVLVGQFFGSTLPARFFGEGWRDSFAIGTYMSCKGIVELVVLGILFQANVLSSVSYAALVVMAIVVTAATKPLIDVMKPSQT